MCPPNELIKGLSILGKYVNMDSYIIGCEHDEFTLWMDASDKEKMSQEDIEALEVIGFFWNADYEGWTTYV